MPSRLHLLSLLMTALVVLELSASEVPKADWLAQAPKQPQAAQAREQTAKVVIGNQPPEVIDAMRKVHAGFDGNEGYVGQFGDSITYSMAFWAAFDWSAPDQYLPANDGLPKTPVGKRWRDVIQGARNKGPKFANYSGWKVGQLMKTADEVLQRDKPEVALIMIGTNDISGGQVPSTYEADLRKLIQKCTAAHCVPIVNTIPPRRDRNEAVAEINTLVRKVAKELKVPLADYHAEIVRLRPDNTWDGTLISKDGVHPSGGKTHIYTDENLRTCGYALRNWVNFLVLRQLHFQVLHRSEEE